MSFQIADRLLRNSRYIYPLHLPKAEAEATRRRKVPHLKLSCSQARGMKVRIGDHFPRKPLLLHGGPSSPIDFACSRSRKSLLILSAMFFGFWSAPQATFFIFNQLSACWGGAANNWLSIRPCFNVGNAEGLVPGGKTEKLTRGEPRPPSCARWQVQDPERNRAATSSKLHRFNPPVRQGEGKPPETPARRSAMLQSKRNSPSPRSYALRIIRKADFQD